MIVPAALQAVLVVVLRQAVDTKTAPGYTMNLDPDAVLTTFATQASAALPLSQWLFHAPSVPAINAGAVIVAALACGVPVLASMLAVGATTWRPSWASVASIAVFGLWIWLSSSALIAVTVRWQTDLRPGQGYLAVVYGYLGCALLALAAWLAGSRMVAGRSTAVRRTWTISSALVIAAVATATMAGNLAVTTPV